jgi:hypothetical protein
VDPGDPKQGRTGKQKREEITYPLLLKRNAFWAIFASSREMLFWAVFLLLLLSPCFLAVFADMISDQIRFLAVLST